MEAHDARTATVPQPRVLMLGPHQTIRGATPILVPLLIEALRNRGYDVESEPWGRMDDSETLVRKIVRTISDVRRVRNRVRRGRFDVIFVQSSHDWKTISRDASLLLFTKKYVNRSLIQVHGSRYEEITGAGHRLFKMATRAVLALSDGMIFSSTLERDAFRTFAPRHMLFAADNIYVPEPDNERPSIPESWNVDHRPIVFFAARLIPEKGIEDFLDAMEIVVRDHDCHALIAGTGPLEREVTSRVSRSPLAGRADLMGHLDRAHLRLALDLAAMFVLPTYHVEGFPQTIQEALGRGCPVVTTQTRGLADHIADAVHGRVVPARDPAALAVAISDLLTDPAARGRMAEAGRHKALDFAPAVVARQYAEILEAVSAG